MDNLEEVPTVEFHAIGEDSWMALNASLTLISTGAMDYRTQEADEHHATGPTGVFLEMEWALDMDWYDHDASWRPFIPLRPSDPSEGALDSIGFSISICRCLGHRESVGVLPSPSRLAQQSTRILPTGLGS